MGVRVEPWWFLFGITWAFGASSSLQVVWHQEPFIESSAEFFGGWLTLPYSHKCSVIKGLKWLCFAHLSVHSSPCVAACWRGCSQHLYSKGSAILCQNLAAANPPPSVLATFVSCHVPEWMSLTNQSSSSWGINSWVWNSFRCWTMSYSLSYLQMSCFACWVDVSWHGCSPAGPAQCGTEHEPVIYSAIALLCSKVLLC